MLLFFSRENLNAKLSVGVDDAQAHTRARASCSRNSIMEIISSFVREDKCEPPLRRLRPFGARDFTVKTR